MNKLIKIYKDAFNNLTKKGRTWRQYVIHLFIAIGTPMSLMFFVITILASLEITSVNMNGKEVSGIETLVPGLAASFIFVPFLCLIVGSIAYFSEEIFSKK